MNYKKSYITIMLCAIAASLALTGCATKKDTSSGNIKSDPLSALSDEFEDSSTLGDWKKVDDTQFNNEYIEKMDINETIAGQLFIKPKMGTWYGAYTGHLSYKEITGDFIVTAKIKVTGESSSIPTGQFDLAGLMARVPSSEAGKPVFSYKENWEYVTTGGNDNKRIVDFKRNQDGRFTYDVVQVNTEWIELKMVRVGSALVKFYKEDGGEWQLLSHFNRTDFPDKLQVGFCLLTDLRGNPDNLSYFDYIRFQTPPTPDKKLLNKMEGYSTTVEDWEAFLAE